MRRMFENFEFDKENFESYLPEDFVLDDEQWETICDDLEGSVGNYIDELLGITVVNIEEGTYFDK
jgi:hypothetical protein